MASLLAGLAESGALPPDLEIDRFSVASPPLRVACDLSVDVSLLSVRATERGFAPCTVARALAALLAQDPDVAGVEVAGRGLVNVVLAPQAKAAAIASALTRNVVASVPTADPPWCADLTLTQARSRAVADALARLHGSAVDAAQPAIVCGPVSVRRGGGSPPRSDLAVGVAIREIGIDALRFALTAKKPDAALVIDFDASAERSRQNPSFWICYAHARAQATLRGARSAMPDVDLSPAALAEADFTRCRAPSDLTVVRHILDHPQVLAAAAATRSLHRLAAALSGVADAVHAQWSLSKDQPQSRFVNEERRVLLKARLGLMTASAGILKSGLGVLGVTAPDEMR